MFLRCIYPGHAGKLRLGRQPWGLITTVNSVCPVLSTHLSGCVVFFVKSYPGIRHRAAGGWEWQRSPLPPSIVNSLHEHVLGPLLYTLSPTPASVWFGLVFCLLSILSTIKEADSCPCWLAGRTEGRCGHQGLEKQHSGAAGQRDVRKGRTPCSFQRGFTCELHSHLNSGLC